MASTDLPLEIWLSIFYYISDTKDLGNCRLTSKSLDPLAEKAMFRRVTLTPKNGRHFIAIVAKPRIRQHVHCVELDFYGPNLRLYKQILKMLLELPNLKILNDSISEKKYLSALLTFAQEPAAKSLKLEQLPKSNNPYRLASEQYLQLLCQFKETLQSFSFTLTLHRYVYTLCARTEFPEISTYFLQLQKLRRLEISSFDNGPDGMKRFEDMLKGFVYLESLHLKIKEDNNCDRPPNA